MERRCVTDVAFRLLSANAAPDYRSMARFRRRHLRALDDLFTQVLVLCATAGLLKLGRVALDGTKLRASASADSEPFRTPVPIESVHRFRRFRTPAEEKLVAAGAR